MVENKKQSIFSEFLRKNRIYIIKSRRKTEKMSEIIEVSPEKTANLSEKIVFNIEKIDTEAEKITEIIPEKKRGKGQRGMDKAPRRYNQNSLRNLKQFKNIIPQKPDSNNWIWIIVGIMVVVVIAIIMLANLCLIERKARGKRRKLTFISNIFNQNNLCAQIVMLRRLEKIILVQKLYE